jgi:hypothetical protein
VVILMIVQGDHGYSLSFITKKGTILDLTNTAVEVALSRNGEVINKPARIVDPLKGQCEVIFSSSDLQYMGAYTYQWTVYFQDGRIFSGNPLSFYVRDKISDLPPGDTTDTIIVPFAKQSDLEALEQYVEGIVISGGGSVVTDSNLNGNIKVNNTEVSVYDDSALIQEIEALKESGVQGPQGLPGEDGLSAYQIWLNAGNTGTEADFLASLKGEKGDSGTGGGTVPDNVILFEDWLGGESVTIDTGGVIPPADTTAPVLTITAGGTFTGTKSVTMSVNETADIFYTLDGSAPSTSSTKYTAPLSISATTTLKAFAKDTAGNQSTVQTVTYTLDVTPPADTTAPDNVTNLQATPSQNSVALSWTASASSDVASYDVFNGSTLLANVTGTTYNVNGLTASTEYTFTVKAKDAANNTASGTSVTVTTSAPVDTTAPVLTITPAATFTDTQTVTMSTNETSTIWYTRDDSDPKTSGTKVQYTAPLTLTETDTIKAYAVDSANNASSVQTVTYTKQIVQTQAVIYEENGYLSVPAKIYNDYLNSVWKALTGYESTNYIGVTNNFLITNHTLFDTSDISTLVLSDGLPYVTHVVNMAGVEQEAHTIPTNGSPANKLLLWLSKTKGATITDITNYVKTSGLRLKYKLASGYKTHNISSNISNVTTRTSGVGTEFEYFKCNLLDGIPSGYTPPTTAFSSAFASNGYYFTETPGYVFSDQNPAIRINADSTLEMLLPKGTLSSFDVAGVSAYLAVANLKIYYI